ncbi:FMN-binding negative transcriptional regulator [Zestomonas carbonaria]|uniref:Protease synthase and sporulation protein PAI 2 n=1 Tax=Zestomonas carbonaria TaxID=2762745 RepID=A0A7U7ELD4_9GAMM|nr:FMN-binding negative transcriptional regulator [Pseudomonas carbonaria]CAD5107144.1 Protease synthase and sporulation protein PAI 2 [Pseudomonas carbonaria]
MYIPRAFAETDLARLHEQIERTPLAILVSQGADGLQASHLPLLLERGEGERGTLYGHFARGNPQWRALADGGEVLLVFPGDEGYVSPGFYPGKGEHGRVVPTWNYVAVHAYGRVEVFDDRERLLALVSRLSQHHEQDRALPWAVSDAPADYIAGMLRAIVGFAIPIERLEGKWKLSQNKDERDRAGVRQGLAESPRDSERRLARQMAED